MSADEDLDRIDKWCAVAQKHHPSYVIYTDALPTKSVRSQMLALSAEVRALRALCAWVATYDDREEPE